MKYTKIHKNILKSLFFENNNYNNTPPPACSAPPACIPAPLAQEFSPNYLTSPQAQNRLMLKLDEAIYIRVIYQPQRLL